MRVVTGIVLLVVAVTKAHEGAWIIMLLIPVLVAFFRVTHTHYRRRRRAAVAHGRPGAGQPHATTPCWSRSAGVHRAVVQALDYARTLSPDVRAVYVDVDPAATDTAAA